MTKSIHELHNDWKNSKGYGLHTFLLHIEYLEYSFNNNYRQLIKVFKDFKDFIVNLGADVEPSKLKLKNFNKRFINRFFNFVSICYAMEENYCEFLDRINKDLLDDFKEFLETPERLFIFALRNNITHEEVLKVSTSIQYHKEENASGNIIVSRTGNFTFSRYQIQSDFFSVFGRGTKSKFLKKKYYLSIVNSYIRNFKGQSIKLDEPITNYFALFKNKLETINISLRTLYGSELKESTLIHRRIVNIQKGIS